MNTVRAKKNLGQHFLTDKDIATGIVNSLLLDKEEDVLEIGPGMGILTRLLLQKENCRLKVVEIDRESVEWLNTNIPQLNGKIINKDFLKLDISQYFQKPFFVIGNLPYNISSQIFFRILTYKDMVPQIVCMLQKEVAERLCAGPGSKTYGILSVILQAWYKLEYLFTVHEHVFSPPPKVKSAVIRFTRNERTTLDCDEALFIKVIKMAFNQRRKTLRNSLKQMLTDEKMKNENIFSLRPEQLSVAEFEQLTNMIAKQSGC